MSEEIKSAADLQTAIAGIADVLPVSSDEQAAIRRNTAYALPDSPAEHGMRAGTVKPAFWRGIVGQTDNDEYNVVYYLNRLAATLNTDIKTLCDVLLELVKADTALEGEISALQGKDTALEGEISALQGKDTALEGEISALQGKDTALEGEISALQGKDTALEGEISALQGKDTALETALAGKVAKVAKKGVLYGTAENGGETTLPWWSGPKGSSIMYRKADGTSCVADAYGMSSDKLIANIYTVRKLIDDVPDASENSRGYMTPTQVKNLATLVALLKSKDDTTIDTIAEVLRAFENSPEGTNVAKALAGKIPISESAQVVYANDSNGAPIVKAYTSSATEDTIVYRTNGGYFDIPDAENDGHPAAWGQVRRLVEPMERRVVALEKAMEKAKYGAAIYIEGDTWDFSTAAGIFYIGGVDDEFTVQLAVGFSEWDGGDSGYLLQTHFDDSSKVEGYYKIEPNAICEYVPAGSDAYCIRLYRSDLMDLEPTGFYCNGNPMLNSELYYMNDIGAAFITYKAL